MSFLACYELSRMHMSFLARKLDQKIYTTCHLLRQGVIGRQTQEGSKCGADAGTMMAPWDLQGVQGRGGSIGKDYSKPWMVVGPAGEPAHGYAPLID